MFSTQVIHFISRYLITIMAEKDVYIRRDGEILRGKKATRAMIIKDMEELKKRHSELEKPIQIKDTDSMQDVDLSSSSDSGGNLSSSIVGKPLSRMLIHHLKIIGKKTRIQVSIIIARYWIRLQS